MWHLSTTSHYAHQPPKITHKKKSKSHLFLSLTTKPRVLVQRTVPYIRRGINVVDISKGEESDAKRSKSMSHAEWLKELLRTAQTGES